MTRTNKLIALIAILVFVISVLVSCAPVHTCQSKCETCGLCANDDCTEKACSNKCKCADSHICQSICEICGLCANDDCAEKACSNKCKCVEVHTCKSVCASCGQCTNKQCTDKACSYKCSCKICIACNLCYECNDKRCELKCGCESPKFALEHLCEHVCALCGLCLSDCREGNCDAKCDGNHPANEWELIADRITTASYTYTVPKLTTDQEVDFCNLYQEYVDADRQNNYDGGSGGIVLFEYYGTINNLHYLCIGYRDPEPMDPSHILTIEGVRIAGSHRHYVFVSDGTNLVRVDHAYQQGLITLDNVKELSCMILANKYYTYNRNDRIYPYTAPTTFQINIIWSGSAAVMFYIGDQIGPQERLTPREFRLPDINGYYKTMEAFCKERTFYLVELDMYISKMSSSSFNWQYQCFYSDLVFQAYLNLYCK